ncbi:MAG: electron transport complex subunit RsxC [Paludibacteraceae bacterium]|nr:electron transport complex subunit RsxC [Paludibacteraceae bacterium]MBN2787317.1 electron transport complex subunit RsxC [Paludibacteraceae bacterium]
MKTFKIGGIHPPENKLSANKTIQVAPLPTQAIVMLGQCLGAPSTPVVEKGSEVKVGTLLAKSSGFVSANLHAPVSGKVVKIDEFIDASGYKKSAVVIDVEGDVWEDAIDRSTTLIKEIKASKEEIIKKIADAGIVGLGGATFPTHIKLTPPPGKTAEVLIINGVECEPYLTSDHQLMMEKGEEIVVGITILMKAIGVNRAIIGIENNKPDAIAHLRKIVAQYSGIEVCPLKVQYPQGGEKQLIDAIINRQVPSGTLPVEVGAVVQNIGTAFAVYEAVQKNKPLFERIITITGKSVKTPCNLLARIGTPFSQLIDFCGGLPNDTAKIVGGGPMMGKALVSVDVPMTKGSSGLLMIPEAEAQRQTIRNCIRCGKCVSACAMGIEPFLLMATSERAMWEEAESAHIMDCIECGSCMFVCPSNRPLLDYIRLGKAKVGAIIRSRK